MNIPLFGWLQNRFPIETIIVAKRNNAYKIAHDKMRRVMDKESGHEYYTFWKAKGEYTPLPFDKILASDKGNTAFLFSPATGQYYLMDIVEQTEEKEFLKSRFENGTLIQEKVIERVPIIQPVDEKIRQTATVLHHRIDMRFPRGKTFMEKYGALILIIVWGLAIAIPMIFYPAFLSAVTDKLGGITGQINQIISQIQGIQGALPAAGGSVVPTTPPPV